MDGVPCTHWASSSASAGVPLWTAPAWRSGATRRGVAVVAENGAGKSTLLIEQAAGRVWLDSIRGLEDTYLVLIADCGLAQVPR
jgi:hypothetical protein